MSMLDRSVRMEPSQGESLERAGNMVEKQLLADSSFPSLLDLTHGNIPVHNITKSGLQNNEYFEAKFVCGGNVDVKEMVTVSKVPLPPEITEHFRHLECHSMMGIFPEIHRAWLAIDSDIYVWTYEKESDVAYFDGLSETIVSVGLVQPKKGVFQPFIKYLLVLTTVSEIVVLGVTFTQKNDGVSFDELHVIQDPVFVVPTEGVPINTVVGTSLGRIFLGGRDGSLYEILYQAESSWFGKRCKKVNHSTSSISFLVPQFLKFSFSEEEGIVEISVDNSRHILYTLTDKGTVSVYDLEDNGQGCHKVSSMKQSAIVSIANAAVNTFEINSFRPIVSISAIEKSESLHFNLVVVAESGVRLYFTVNPNDFNRPTYLKMLHVRIPPGYAANAPTDRPQQVHLAHYRKGNTILTCMAENDKEMMWCLSNDLFSHHRSLVETFTCIPLDGIVWAMCEVTGEDMRSVLKCLNAPEYLVQIPFVQQPLDSQYSQQPFPNNQLQQQQQHNQLQQHRNSQLFDPPLSVRQHMEAPRKYVFLTPQGVEVIMKLRPVDVLKQIMLKSGGPDTKTVKQYFKHLSEDQACATCLILACFESTQNMQIAEWATRAFFRYGGEPTAGISSITPNVSPFQQTLTPGFNPSAMSTPVHGGFQSQTTVPLLSETVSPTTQFSAKHNGLYLYVCRILRPIWNLKVVERLLIDYNIEILSSTVPKEDCIWILGHLHGLRSFLEKNTFSSAGLMSMQRYQDSMDMGGQTYSQRMTALKQAQVEEKRSLDALKVFVKHTCEVLGLWKILCEHQFHVIVGSLAVEQQHQLVGMTFKSLILNGSDLCSSLITCVINRYLSDNASVDAISTKLREICPNLYRNEDAACSKASELIMGAKSAENKEEKEERLKSALTLLCKAAPYIKLDEICHWFSSVHYYEGIMRLCLACAEKCDPNNVALHFYKNDQPQADQEGSAAYAKRMQCYKNLTDILDQLYIQSLSSPHSSSFPIAPGPPVRKEVCPVTPTEAGEEVLKLVSSVLQSNDELFHVAIYEWMMRRDLTNELVKVTCSSLQTFLNKTADKNPQSMYIYDLLWKYYEMNKNRVEAAQVLEKLANKEGDSIDLTKRISYLSRAIMNLHLDSAGYAPHHGSLLRNLEKDLQTAKIQEQILNAIKEMGNPNSEETIKRLNSAIFTAEELYTNFAEPLNLWKVQLSLIRICTFINEEMVMDIWIHIIETELQKLSSMPGEEQMTNLMNLVKSIGKECDCLPRLFPLAFLIKTLELQNCRLRGNPSQVYYGLASVGVSLLTLLLEYEKLFSMKDHCWKSAGDEFHLIRVIGDLISYFVANSTVVLAADKRIFTTKAADVIASCLTTIYTSPNTEELVNELRSVQSRLNRLS